MSPKGDLTRIADALERMADVMESERDEYDELKIEAASQVNPDFCEHPTTAFKTCPDFGSSHTTPRWMTVKAVRCASTTSTKGRGTARSCSACTDSRPGAISTGA